MGRRNARLVAGCRIQARHPVVTGGQSATGRCGAFAAPADAVRQGLFRFLEGFSNIVDAAAPPADFLLVHESFHEFSVRDRIGSALVGQGTFDRRVLSV